MKYECPDCQGHAEIEGDYHGEALPCPHCSATVQFFPVETSAPPLLVATSNPPVGGSAPIVSTGEQDAAETAAVLEQVRRYCTPDESILRLVVQSKLMSASLKPDVIAVTSRRLIILYRGLMSCRMCDALWIDVADVTSEERMLGAVVSVRVVNGQIARLEKLPKEAARELYRLCQTREETMRAARYAQQVHVAAASAARINVNVNR